MFDNINLPTIIISFSTSILVSLFTFILGLRAGKNQNDRQRLKQTYKDIYVYISSILEGLNENVPVQWSDYKTVWKKDNGHSLTPLKEKEVKGELVELYNHKISVLVKNEIEYLRYGYELNYKVLPLINSFLLEEINRLYKIEGYLNDNTTNYSFFIENKPTDSYTSISVTPKMFLCDKEIAKLFSIDIKNNQYYAFNYTLKDKTKTIYIESKLINEPKKFFQ
jgi:hypothetical protein